MTDQNPSPAVQPQADTAHPTTAEIPFIYPAHWEADVVLRDGATAHLRPVLPTDRDALNTMYEKQSERSIYLRFFAPKPKLSDKELTRFTTVDHNDRVAFVLYLGEELIGIGRYDRTLDPTEAEVAFLISDHHQGRGIGSILLEHLAAAALERGIEKFSAEVLPENRKMMNVFAEAGYEVTRAFDDGFVIVQFDIDPTDRSRQVMESREHRAEAKSIAELLAPERVVVIGNNEVWQKETQPLLKNIVDGGYTGELYALNISATPESYESAEGYRLLVSADELTSTELPIDLALITLPTEAVIDAVNVCGNAGIRGALIYSTGYAHDGARGRARQKTLVSTARLHGMRIIGPESFGVLNTNPEISLDTTLTNRDPEPGTLGLFSQSATVGAVFSHSAVRRNIGISTLISAGNRADVSGNDLMQYWEDDPDTTVCALYLESIGNPRKFSRIARRLSRVKPVIVAKNAVTGLQLPPGHSARTSIAPSQALSSMFTQAGIITADSNDRLLDIAQIMVSMPQPAGRRIAVLTNAPVLGQMVADRIQQNDMDVKVKEDTLTLGEDSSLELLEEITHSSLDSSDIDALIAVFLTEGKENPNRISQILLNQARQANKPVIAVYSGAVDPAQNPPGIFTDHTENQTITGLPVYEGTAEAVDALAAVMNYVEWREKETGTTANPSGISPKETARYISSLMPQVPGEQLLELTQEQAHKLLQHYGISVLRAVPITTVEDAKAAVAELGGYPVVLKSTDRFLARRIDLGGVRIGIESDEQLEAEISVMHRMLAQYGPVSLEVQQQAPGGETAVLEAIEDPLLGPVLSYGFAGDATTLLDDWAHRIPPLTERDIYKMVRSPRAAAKLFDAQGQPAVRTDLLEDLIARVALMKDNHPEIASLKLAPIMVAKNELNIAYASIKLGNPQQRTDSARRTMTAH